MARSSRVLAPKIAGLRPQPGEEMALWQDQRLDKGMFTVLDPSNVPDGGLVDALNARVRYMGTNRRIGHSIYNPTHSPLSAEAITDIFSYIESASGSRRIVAFTPTKFLTAPLDGTSVWTQYNMPITPFNAVYGANVAITGISTAGNGQITTGAVHGLSAGQYVYISGTNAVPDINGFQKVLAIVSSTIFTLDNGTGNPILYTSGGSYIATYVKGATGTSVVRAPSDKIQSIAVQYGTGFGNAQRTILAFCQNGKDALCYLTTFATFDTPGIYSLYYLKTSYSFVGVTAQYWAPKFITSFYNRIIVANFVGPSKQPTTIAWSGDTNFAVWPNMLDPVTLATDPSSGISPLTESPEDTTDAITGLFGFANSMVIMREKSIWTASKQPIASSPFYFSAAVPTVGSDCPYSIIHIPSGLSFVDTASRTVWAYTVGIYGYANAPESIGRPIETSVLNNLSNKDQVIGSFNPVDQELKFRVPQLDGTMSDYIYSLKSKAWSRDTINGVAGGLLDINGVCYHGKTTGDIIKEDTSSVDDAGSTYSTTIETKDFEVPEKDVHIAQIKVEYKTTVAGSLTLSYSRDGGVTWVTGPTKAMTVGIPHLFIMHKNIKTRRIRFRMTSSTGLAQFLRYEIHIYPAGLSRDTYINRS